MFGSPRTTAAVLTVAALAGLGSVAAWSGSGPQQPPAPTETAATKTIVTKRVVRRTRHVTVTDAPRRVAVSNAPEGRQAAPTTQTPARAPAPVVTSPARTLPARQESDDHDRGRDDDLYEDDDEQSEREESEHEEGDDDD